MRVVKKLSLALGASLGLGLSVQAQALTVATSFSIIEDMVKNVAGDEVKVVNLVGPNSDVHSFELAPSDVAKLGGSDKPAIFFVNGLGLDEWSQRMVKAANFNGQVVVLSEGIKERKFEDAHDHGHEDLHAHEHDEQTDNKTVDKKDAHDDHDHHHGDIDPHAWQSLPNAQVYVDNIAKALIAADPENKARYESNAQNYKQQLSALHQEIKAAFEPLAHERRYLVTSHEALGYFADEFHLHLVAPLGFSSSAQPSAKEVANVVKQIRQAKIPAVFLENVKNPNLLEQIARESGAKVGGTLYTDALATSGPASSYLGMYKENARVILEALK